MLLETNGAAELSGVVGRHVVSALRRKMGAPVYQVRVWNLLREARAALGEPR